MFFFQDEQKKYNSHFEFKQADKTLDNQDSSHLVLFECMKPTYKSSSRADFIEWSLWSSSCGKVHTRIKLVHSELKVTLLWRSKRLKMIVGGIHWSSSSSITLID